MGQQKVSFSCSKINIELKNVKKLQTQQQGGISKNPTLKLDIELIVSPLPTNLSFS